MKAQFKPGKNNRLLVRLLRALPERIGRLFYVVAFNLLQLAISLIVAKQDRPEIWARNSWVFDTFVPFLSDLDLTLWFETEPSEKSVQDIKKILSVLSKVFPFLGETNVYVASDLKIIREWMNPFELDRDPSLRANLEKPSAAIGANGVYASIFLLRMLEGDIENVLFFPELRRKKWDFHFQSVQKQHGMPLKSLWENFPERSLLRGICETVVAVSGISDPGQFSQAIDSLERYFECWGRHVPLHTINTDKWWWIFLPHRFCFGDNLPPQFLASETLAASIFKAQMEWELFGVFTQSRLSDTQNSNQHIASLKRVAERALGGGSGEVDFLKKINTLLEYRGIKS